MLANAPPDLVHGAMPLLVVDLERGPGDVHLPVAAPLVVVGVGRADPSTMVRGVDVALSPAGAPGRPWVAGDIGPIADRVRDNPQSSVALAQVLRATEQVEIDSGLLIESLAYSTLQGGSEFRRWLQGRPTKASTDEQDVPVVLERDGPTLTITLDRPGVHNSYNAAMRDALCEALALVAEDDSITAVELRGAGPSFCSGGDLTEFGTFPDPATAHFVRTGQSPARYLAGLAPRVTAWLHGWCVGSGIELPAFAGRVVAAADTRIRLPEPGMGLIPGAGGTVSIPRRIGRQRTAWLALTGATLDASAALDWGLVDEIQAELKPGA